MPVTAPDSQSSTAGGSRPGTGLTNQLWERYRATGDPQARSQLLDSYLGLVHHYAHEVRQHAPPEVELDDLIGSGTVGLIQALETFDPTRGVAFSSFAVPRIRGAILDELRSLNWLPRSAVTRSRDLSRAEARLQQRLGRAPEAAEIAAELGVNMETYWRWREDRDGRTVVRLDHPVSVGRAQTAQVVETIPDGAAADPSERVGREETLIRLREALSALPPKDRLVLSLYFYEETNLKQIGEVLHISESRVSQIRTRALQRLRAALGQHPEAP